jgi:tetratricopeptide (TPR) repeat protein
MDDMQEDIHHILATLKDVPKTTQDNGQATGDALAQASAALVQEGLRKLVGPIRLSSDDQIADPSRLLQSVLDAIERSGIALEDSPEKAHLMIEIGEILYIQGKWDDAIERFGQAAAISTRIDFLAGQTNALRQTGRIKRRRGDWETAPIDLEKAVELDQNLEDPAGKSEALLNLGNIKYEQGHYEETEALFQDALVTSEHLYSNKLIGDISMSRGVIRHVMGHNDEAITHFTESLANFEVISDQRRISQACHTLGLAYAAQGMWTQSGTMYERALDIPRDLGD